MWMSSDERVVACVCVIFNMLNWLLFFTMKNHHYQFMAHRMACYIHLQLLYWSWSSYSFFSNKCSFNNWCLSFLKCYALVHLLGCSFITCWWYCLDDCTCRIMEKLLQNDLADTVICGSNGQTRMPSMFWLRNIIIGNLSDLIHSNY